MYRELIKRVSLFFVFLILSFSFVHASAEEGSSIISPADGAVLESEETTFEWQETAATRYWLYVGKRKGGREYYNRSQGKRTSVTIESLPTDGSTLYLRLWSRINGQWKYSDHKYTAFKGISIGLPVEPSQLISPKDNITFDSASVNFEWKDSGASKYWLTIGNRKSSGIYYSRNQGTNTSVTVNNLPVDGSKVYARLWSRVEGRWSYYDYQFTAYTDDTVAKPSAAKIENHEEGATVAVNPLELAWNDSGASRYWLYIGGKRGKRDYYSGSQGDRTSASINKIPKEASDIYVRLWSRVNGRWLYSDSHYRTEQENTAPTIKGTPKASVTVGEKYYFKPESADAEGDTLTFSVEGKPTWAEFDAQTGELSGTPAASDVGTTNDIVILVSDNKLASALPAFSIEVKQAVIVDIAKAFGKATQGKTYANDVASKAIDDNLNSYNHTQCNTTDNWWQLELPKPTAVNSVVIQGRASNTHRLEGAIVYLTQAPYSGAFTEADKVATLKGTADKQAFELEKSANYLIVKAQGANCLHMANVEVYGVVPEAPYFMKHKADYMISFTAEQESTVATIKATDYQSDELEYSIAENVPFSIDQKGSIYVNGSLGSTAYPITVIVSDGEHTAKAEITITVSSQTAVEDALKSGKVDELTADELIEATLKEIEASKTFMQDAKAHIFNINEDGSVKADGSSLTVIDWNPTHDASLFNATLGKNTSLLQTNAVTKENRDVVSRDIAIIGEKGTARYAVFGSNPFRTAANEQMDQVLENTLAWLAGRTNLKQEAFTAVIAQLDDSYWFKDESKTRAWLDTHYAKRVTYNDADVCDGDVALAICLESAPDVLIISQVSTQNENVDAIADVVNHALEAGISVLYIHHDGDQKPLGRALFNSVFDVQYTGDNYWKNLQLKAYNPAAKGKELSGSLADIKRMFMHFQQNDYQFDWSQCDDENCKAVSGFQADFLAGAKAVKVMMNALDTSKKNIFDEPVYRLQKLLALTADKMRQEIAFPMDKVTSDDNDYLRAYYADHAVYNYREINPVQKDMGNFSRSDFSHIEPVTKTIDMISKHRFRAAGVYALPGQSFSVTRNDESDVVTTVFINTQRSGSTHEFAKNGYSRPKFLKSVAFPIKNGETIKVTSPYGGTVQIGFNKNDLPVSFTFENIGEHPYWNDEEDNEIFEKQMTAGDYDWAELSTPGFEVHSSLEKMHKSIESWGGAPTLAAATMRYMHNFPHALAGFQGDGIDPIPELIDFAKENNWKVRTLDKVQHMNADQATCGYGCSGNPYDAYWSFSPIGHGDVHELGHGLQGGRRFAGWENHSMTNYYSYFTKSQYYKDTGDDPDCQKLPFESDFNILQASINQANPAAYVKENLWDNNSWSKSAAMFIQMMMAVQHDEALADGWLLRGRLHMFDRALSDATADDEAWQNQRSNLGMDSYSRDEAKKISNNDWYLIALSYVTKRDFRDYLKLWAIPYGEKASTQVESLDYAILPRKYFKSDKTAYCKGLDKPAIAIDGVASWVQ